MLTNFGAFVDIGVHQDGLVHISELAHKFVEDPRKVVNPGDQVMIKVMKVDAGKNQISLTMKLEATTEHKTFRDTKESRSAQSAQTERRPQAGGKPTGGSGSRPHQPNARPQERSQSSSSGGFGGGKPASPFNNPFAALLNNNNNKK